MGSVTPLLRALQTLRVRVRTDEIWLAIFGALVGALAGLCAVAMNQITQFAHRKLFLLHAGQRLSGAFAVNHERLLLVPMLGGLLIGILAWGLARHWPRRPVDPIEANALHGGRMSMRDSLIVAIQTMISNGAGASVGLEAAYAQVGGAVGSKLALAFNLRRNDMRILVGAGTAGAIAAAFNAPLTGAFYAFELVIGTYSLTNLAPVLLAAAASVGIIHLFEGGTMSTQIVITGSILPIDYVPILALGLICALLGIALMRAVTLTEDIVRLTHLPVWLRTAIGGLIVGGLGLISPQVLSAGHGAMEFGLTHKTAMVGIALLFGLKSLASAVSLGTGFRGGLFFASLFLGALVGKLFAACLAMVTVSTAVPPVVFAIVGMSALAVAVVGGPLTMAFLALESTGSLPMTVAVVAASVVSAVTVRRTFGYSFATWRFHLRGEAIRSAVDIGWMRNLTVGRMMRREVRSVRADTSLTAFRRDFPLGATTRVVVVDDANRYAGIVLLSEAHAADTGADGTLADLLHHQSDMLLPQMTIKDAVVMFEQAESDALAVVDSPQTRRVLGLLTEQYALRRYSEELDRRRRELSGE